MGRRPKERRREGEKELIAVIDGYRESKQSWMELLLDLKQRGLTIEPKLAIGDGGAIVNCCVQGILN
jgi:transposase-like protein